MSACSRNRGLVVPPSYCAAMATQADTYSTAAWDEDGAGNGATETVPPVTEAASGLAWSQHDDTELIQCPPWHLAWAESGAVPLIATVIAIVTAMGGGVWMATHRQPSPPPTPAALPAPSRTVISVQAAPPSTVTLQAPPPSTVTVRVTATKTAAPVEIPEPSATRAVAPIPAIQPTVPMLSAEDQMFIARQRADGWVILDLQQMLRTAHLVCQKFRQGESAQQVNQELASMPPGRGDMQMALSFSSNPKFPFLGLV